MLVISPHRRDASAERDKKIAQHGPPPGLRGPEAMRKRVADHSHPDPDQSESGHRDDQNRSQQEKGDC